MRKTLVFFMLLFPMNGPVKDDVPENMAVKEADAVVQLYEARLNTSRCRYKHYLIERDYEKDNYLKTEHLHKTGLVTTREFISVKKTYESAEVVLELRQCDIQERLMELNLVKVRRELTCRGLEPKLSKLNKETFDVQEEEP